LLEAHHPTEGRFTFAYNADGQRVARETETAERKFVYDARKLLAETDSGVTTVSYDFSMHDEFGELVSRRHVGGTEHHQFDALGSTDRVTDSSEFTTDTYVYGAFGDVHSRTGTSESPLTFVGQLGYYAEPALGLYFLNARYYDLAAGQFISCDPIAADVTPYRYVRNGPVNAADPSGLKVQDHHWFPRWGGSGEVGQARVDAKCAPPGRVNIHRFTTALDSKAHSFLHYRFGYNAWAGLITNAAPDCCTLLLGIQTLRNLAWVAMQHAELPLPHPWHLHPWGGRNSTDAELAHLTAQACRGRRNQTFAQHWREFERTQTCFNFQDFEDPFTTECRLLTSTAPDPFERNNPRSVDDWIQWHALHAPEGHRTGFTTMLIAAAVAIAIAASEMEGAAAGGATVLIIRLMRLIPAA
jgi:RHS repeat-associated protein